MAACACIVSAVARIQNPSVFEIAAMDFGGRISLLGALVLPTLALLLAAFGGVWHPLYPVGLVLACLSPLCIVVGYVTWGSPRAALKLAERARLEDAKDEAERLDTQRGRGDN
jgi:hypothetical protein